MGWQKRKDKKSKVMRAIIVVITILALFGVIAWSMIEQPNIYSSIKNSLSQNFQEKDTYKLSLEEKKLIGTWSFESDSEFGKLSAKMTFNADRTCKIDNSIAQVYCTRWEVRNGKLVLDNGGGLDYKLINNDRVLIIAGVGYEKSWW